MNYREAFFSQKHNSSDKYEHYFAIYDHIFSKFYGKNITYLEIGVQSGGSLEVARKLFGSGSTIIGVDIDPKCKELERSKVADHIIIGSQGDKEVIAKIRSLAPQIDVLIDDGSHTQAHMVGTFVSLFHNIREEGVYIIEDTHTIYSPTHQQSFFGISVYDYFKGLTAQLNLDFIDPESRKTRFKVKRELRQGETFPKTELHRNIFSIEFFNSVICVRKKQMREPLRIRI